MREEGQRGKVEGVEVEEGGDVEWSGREEGGGGKGVGALL